MPATSRPPHVVIAGGGVAAVECALALRDLAGDRVRMTMIAPNLDFVLRPLRTAEPFALGRVRRHPLAALAARVGSHLVRAEVTEVRPGTHEVVAGEEAIPYDNLVLAVGGRHVPAYQKAYTFTGDAEAIDYHGLLQDVDQGYTRAISFIVPPGVTWPLPLYELALMTMGEAYAMGTEDVAMQVISPEAAPLALFGTRAAEAVAGLLAQAGIAFRGSTYVRETPEHRFELLPGDEELPPQRIVALPTIAGIRLAGVPADGNGFIPVDEHQRVAGLDGVFAAGDGTSFPVKHGGLACQQADAIAAQLAAAAGAPVEPEPFRPVLRGLVLAGHGAQYLEHAVHGGGGGGDAPSELRLWSASRKVDGRYLSPWLEELDAAPPSLEEPMPGDIDVEVALDDRVASLDPFSPARATHD